MVAMDGKVAITHYDWYEVLLEQDRLDEVNFWTPSAHGSMRDQVGAPFFFKLKARYDHAICGFAYFARYARLPALWGKACASGKNAVPGPRPLV